MGLLHNRLEEKNSLRKLRKLCRNDGLGCQQKDIFFLLPPTPCALSAEPVSTRLRFVRTTNEKKQTYNYVRKNRELLNEIELYYRKQYQLHMAVNS